MNKINLNNISISPGHSQKGQHCYIKALFEQIGTTNKYYVDIGAYNGRTNSNVYDLKVRDNWYGLMIDNHYENASLNLHKYTVTQDNICGIFKQFNVPVDIDLLCIDIDGMDYWILQSILERFSPRVIIIETNVRFDTNDSKVMKYKEEYNWNGIDWYGCSPHAVKKLVNQHNYTPIYMHYDDMIIVRNDNLKQEDIDTPWKTIYPGPNFELYADHVKAHHPNPVMAPIDEDWIEV
tara:strand:+ start:1614 stop:2321 length:708 start_codon:yes stop_codon:yes gene_type:complete